MKLNYLKDKLFDLLNENSEEMSISDIETHEKKNMFSIVTIDGSEFEIELRKA